MCDPALTSVILSALEVSFLIKRYTNPRLYLLFFHKF